MAIRAYRDGKGRTRFAVEFQQGGVRVLRRLHPTATKADAQAYETQLRGEIFRTARLGQAPEISLEEAILRWLRDTLAHKKDKVKPAQNARLLAPFVAGKTLRQAPEAAQAAVACWTTDSHARNPISTAGKVVGITAVPDATQSLKASTINRRLCVLKAAAKHAWKQGWIADNLSGRITLLPEHNRREVYLTAAQVRSLANSSSSPAVQSAIMIAAYSGLRASELLAITRSDLRRDTLSVRESKTGKPRNVPIVSLLRPYLLALPLGLSYWQLHKGFCGARAAAGLPHVRFHDLRHSTASMLINAGVDLYTVGAILGHAGPQTTARYAHLSQRTLKKAMGRLR